MRTRTKKDAQFTEIAICAFRGGDYLTIYHQAFQGGTHMSHESLAEGSQGNPMSPIMDYSGLLGLIRPCWEDLAPLV